MKTLITEFISLDGVVQAPGGANEDTDGGFSHGGAFDNPEWPILMIRNGPPHALGGWVHSPDWVALEGVTPFSCAGP